MSLVIVVVALLSPSTPLLGVDSFTILALNRSVLLFSIAFHHGKIEIISI